MTDLCELNLDELEMILENALEENDFQTVGLILALKELCLEQQETQPSKKKRRQTRCISIPFCQSLAPILESPLE